MDISALAPPTPEVHYLPAIFRKIDRGEIRIPAFQRSFVWSDAQIIELLDSVYRGYPIGSVLFWRVESQILKIEQDELVPFPDVTEQYPTTFILDGMQRLSSLYGVFHHEGRDIPHRFNVVFDLREQQFRHFDPLDPPNVHLPLSTLFAPRQLLDVQRDLAEQADADELIDQSIRLQSIFQEYLIPTVTISRKEVTQVVEIFERVNSMGVRLSAVDFMRALTWSPDFDLTKEVSKVHRVLEENGYDFDPESLVKALAVILDKAPTANDMLGLRNQRPAELHRGISSLRSSLDRVTAFLRDDLKILSSDFVPYEGQLLVLVKMFSLVPRPDQELLAAIRSWFWSVSFSEGLRGKPDHYVARSIRDATKATQGQLTSLDYRFNLRLEDLLDRRFRKGGALSAAIAAMLAVKGARSLISGELIDPESYMLEFSSENFGHLYPLPLIQQTAAANITSASVFANIVIISEADRKRLLGRTPKKLIRSLYERFNRAEVEAILDSQLISPNATQMILQERPHDFLNERAKGLYEMASSLSSREQQLKFQ